MNLAEFMRDARVEEDALGRSRLARVNMSNDADVPNLAHCCFLGCH